MAWKDARKIIDARRERVASLRIRGLTQREIVAALEGQGFINPETGKPFSVGTVVSDLACLQAQWRENASRDIAEHKAELLVELGEVKRAAWAAKKLDTVLRAQEREAKLLGLDAPQRTELTGSDGGPVQLVIVEEIVDADSGDNPTA